MAERKPRLGLIVNPIAGMGGAVGLKGTDGAAALARARALGARPHSEERAELALRALAQALGGEIDLFTGAGAMGERAARAAGFTPIVVGEIAPGDTSAEETRRIATTLTGLDADLILFAGGDGTARVVQSVLGSTARTLALGIPTGVKMHSAIFATSPRAAGDLAARALSGGAAGTREAEVMDIDEEAFRSGRVSARLYGYLRAPAARGLMQNLKSGGQSDAAELAGLAAEIAERMNDGALWIVGPGTTTRAIAERLGLPKTLLGVDLYCRGEVIALDAADATILAHAGHAPAWIVVTPIGGQGYIFGRGNQQLSPAVIRAVGTKRIVIAAATAKLASLRGAPLLADTGNPELDRDLSGHVRVVTGYRAETVQRIAPA